MNDHDRGIQLLGLELGIAWACETIRLKLPDEFRHIPEECRAVLERCVDGYRHPPGFTTAQPIRAPNAAKRTHNMTPENRAKAAERMREYWRKRREKRPDAEAKAG